MYGDLLMRLVNRIRPYEVEVGSTQRLYEKCLESCKKEILNGNYIKFKRNVQKIVHEFDRFIIHEHLWKPKVGVVGEILVKYHPVANNHLEKILANEGVEVVMQDMMDFLFYMAVDDIVKYRLLAGKLSDKMSLYQSDGDGSSSNPESLEKKPALYRTKSDSRYCQTCSKACITW